jgi:uncharacterized phage protein (TIGR01671 family)
MREIKFRAWDNYSNQMLSGDKEVNALWFPNLPMNLAFEYTQRNMYILMQYTGLKDKNGKEIYENDIVQYMQFICEVVFENGVIGKDDGIEHKTPGFMLKFDDGSGYTGLSKEVKVLGNRFENPELLGDRK